MGRSRPSRILTVIMSMLAVIGFGASSASATTLDGTDVSSHNTVAAYNCAAIPGDFIIIKISEGTGYTWPRWRACANEALKAGKKIGFYDFARPDAVGPIAEAQYFVSRAKQFKGRVWTFLDYETNTNVSWAKAWLDYVANNMGHNPGIYLSAGTVNSANWSSISRTYALWIAGYWHGYTRFNGFAPYSLPYRTGSWSTVSMFQYTSSGYLNGRGPYDLNIFYGNASTWDKLANTLTKSASTATSSGTVNNVPKSQTVTYYTDSQMASRVIAGVYGNGDTRKRALGSRYADVMAIVNRRLIGRTASAPVSYYTVRSGDYMSKVWPNNWRAIAALNGLRSPYTIYPGQKLRTAGTARTTSTARRYTVRSGDILGVIARRLGVSTGAIHGYRSGNPNLIYPGETLTY